MLERKASSFLNGWKCRRHRALVIEGMRGVGKTTVVDLFGTTYGSYLRIPMDEPANAGMFNGCSDVDEAIRILNLRFGGMRFVPRDTLIFLDEIGGCPGAVRLLAEFSADGRYDIIAADSFPGAENEYDGLDRYTMRPLDFEEFLWATGRRKDLVAAIREFLAD
ncbi:MAG: AAA family ATPase [Thermoplasmata archaeon]|nr:AAA family ATPase [Thermoplasmata archaeon]